MESNLQKLAEEQLKLQEEAKKQSSFLSEIESAIKRLRNDRKITQANLAKLDGALQAYSKAALLIRDEAKAAASQAGE